MTTSYLCNFEIFLILGYKIHMYDETHDEHNIIHDIMMHQYICDFNRLQNEMKNYYCNLQYLLLGEK